MLRFFLLLSTQPKKSAVVLLNTINDNDLRFVEHTCACHLVMFTMVLELLNNEINETVGYKGGVYT